MDPWKETVKISKKISDLYVKDFEFYLSFLTRIKGEQYAMMVENHTYNLPMITKSNESINAFKKPYVHHVIRLLTLFNFIDEQNAENLTKALYSTDDFDKYLAIKVIYDKYKKYRKFAKTKEGEEALYKILDNFYIYVVKFVNNQFLKRRI